MPGTILLNKLNPHPKNNYYFSNLAGSKYEEIKRSISSYGIRTPLKVTTNYTIVSGHQRFRIAQDLGFKTVPITIVDVDEWEAEYLLIAENVERRGEAEQDPIRKARIAGFLKEYWDIRDGGDRKSEGHNVQLKKIADIAQAVNESEKTTQRLIKLNDLIPEFQQLITDKKLGTTAGEQLAYLAPDTQKELWYTFGEGIGNKTVAEIKDLRQQVQQKEAQINRLQSSLEKLRQREPRKIVVEKVIEKVPDDYQDLKSRAEKIQSQIKDYEKRISQLQSRSPQVIEKVPEDYGQLQQQVKTLKKEKEKVELELLGLTQEQLQQADRYWVRNITTNIMQDVGKHITSLRYELKTRSIDRVVYEDILECSNLLSKIADELQGLAPLGMEEKTIEIRAGTS